MKNKNKALRILSFFLIGVSIGLIIVYSFIRYREDYCTDTLPATPNIYVYAADLMYDSLNRTYVESKGIDKTGDGFRMIEYDDIPQIAVLDGVKGLYIFDDTKVDEMFGRDLSDPLYEYSVPEVIYKYFGGPSAASSMFIPVLGGCPADGSNGICLPQSEVNELFNPPIGSQIVWRDNTYTLTGINKYSFAWVGFTEDTSLYYIYDPATYDDFVNRIKLYCLREDAESHVCMMIVCDEDKSVALQDYLVGTYPASNYSSREFTRVLKSSMNKEFWKKIAVFSVADIVITAAVVTPMLIKSKKKEKT